MHRCSRDCTHLQNPPTGRPDPHIVCRGSTVVGCMGCCVGEGDDTHVHNPPTGCPYAHTVRHGPKRLKVCPLLCERR